MILAGDLGGTKCNLGLFDTDATGFTPVRSQRFDSRSFKSAEEVIQTFLRGEQPKITAAAFAIAGPVVENQVRVTNLPWLVEAGALQRVFHIPHVKLLNDLEATAYALPVLPPSAFATLREGRADSHGNQAMLAAGTGLGEALLIWDGQKRVVSATEGGHCDFTPRNDREIDLLRFLKKRHEIVSVETILSGRGFYELHSFLSPAVKHASFDQSSGQSGADPAPEITRMALAGECPVCVGAAEMWVELYGSEAGNLALKSLARGGVFIAGGIAVKILPMLRAGRFLEAFNHKDKMADLLSAIPITVITDEAAPLWGAAWAASHRSIIEG
jgi:glucokinase